MVILQTLKALADATRLRLFHLLADSELNVNEIARVLGMGQSRISRHLKILTDAGLLASRRDGLWVYYAAAPAAGRAALIEAVTALLRGEAQPRLDRQKAREVLRERGRTTRRFFDSIAGSWEEMKRGILGDFDLNGTVVELLARGAADGAATTRPIGPGKASAGAPAGAADGAEAGRPPGADSSEAMRIAGAARSGGGPPAAPRRTALEVGCGTGDLLARLAERAETVIGVDSSPGMLRRARRRFQGREGVELRLGEAEHLPVRDGEVDLAVMSLVLHHLSNPREGLAEVARALRPGRLFLLVEFGRHGEEALRERFGDRWLGFDPASVEEWLEGAGLRPVERHNRELRPGLRLEFYLSRKRPRKQT